MMQVMGKIIFIILLISCQVCAQSKLRSKSGSLMPPKFDVETSFIDDTGDHVLESEERGALVVKLTNRGGDAREVSVRVAPVRMVQGVIWDSIATFSEIPAGENREATFVLWAGEKTRTEIMSFRVAVENVSKVPSPSDDVEVLLKETAGPHLVMGRSRVYNYVTGRDDSTIIPGQETYVDLEVRNAGPRKARGVVINIVLDNPNVVIKSGNAVSLGDIGPGEKRLAKLLLQSSTKARARSLKLTIQCAEERPKYTKEYVIAFPIRAANIPKNLRTGPLTKTRTKRR